VFLFCKAWNEQNFLSVKLDETVREKNANIILQMYDI